MRYQVSLLKDHERPGSVRLVEYGQTLLSDQLQNTEQHYGTFLSLFGLASNELYIVTCGDSVSELKPPDGTTVAESHIFLPTIRPQQHTPRETPGVYVFRWFKVNPQDVDEIVKLSADAWPDFEDSFDTKVQGLFVEEAPSPQRMLLITWYRDLSVWEDSRHPPDASRENFLRRHQLTKQAKPIATMLSVKDSNQSRGSLVSHS